MDRAFLLIAAPFVGSFVGVLITRMPMDEPVLAGRSSCPACGHALGVRDLLPVVAWLLQEAKCRYCAARIPAFYPAIEIAALLIALWAALATPDWIAWATSAFGWLLLALAVIDDRHRYLPEPLVLLLAALGLAVVSLSDAAHLSTHVVAILLGFGGFAALAKAYRWLRRSDGLGFGDAKLLGAIGAWVGCEGLPTVVLFAAASGLIGVVIRNRSRAALQWRTSLAFGPHLCLGAWLVWLYGPLELAR
jgi:leader peptidase (prepilin peptidase)/N-methyltransferase